MNNDEGIHDHDELNSSGEPKKRIRMYIYILPNLMTTGNLFSGYFAIMQTISGKYLWAAYAIVAAAVFDQLDGRLARLTRSTSKFGAEYDSLCDLVSFCVSASECISIFSRIL
jgi:CDP-diacylglycerol--serine O-phosphatidyltransferase